MQEVVRLEKKVLEKVNKIIDLYDELKETEREIEKLLKKKEQIAYRIGLNIATLKYLLKGSPLEKGEVDES